MEQVYYIAEDEITRFKLDFCCWLVPVKIGLALVGCVNIIIDLVCIIGIATDGLSPTVTTVQLILFEDENNVIKPIPVLAYAIELGFNVVLLCAICRRDIILLRVFLYHTGMALLTSIMTYFIVIAAVPSHIQLAIIISILFQMYCILLIRSVMVKMNMKNKKFEQSRLAKRSLNRPTSNKHPAEDQKTQDVQIIVFYQDDKLKDAKVSEIKKIAKLMLKRNVKKSTELQRKK